MVMGQPVNLGLLRQALIDRCYLDANDPRLDSGSLNRIINEAMQRFDVASPTGWPWQWIKYSAPVPAGGALTSWAFGSGGGPHKIAYVLVADQAGTWQFPIERLTREEQLDRYPKESLRGVPQTYALTGWASSGEPVVATWFRPIPDVQYQITIAGWMLVPELTADNQPVPAQSDYQIGDWNAAIVEYAAALVYRAADDLSEAVSALTDFDAQVLGMRRTKRRTIGEGVPNFPQSAPTETVT
jgi:hypothetical protein